MFERTGEFERLASRANELKEMGIMTLEQRVTGWFFEGLFPGDKGKKRLARPGIWLQ